MSKFVHIVTDQSAMVLNTANGEQVKFFSNDERYQKAIKFIAMGEFDSVFAMDAKTVITKFFDEWEDDDQAVTVKIENGIGVVDLHMWGLQVDLHPVITARILKMAEQGFSPMPIINFISNLYSNESKTAVDELYLFIEQCELPITEDGSFIAYKIVKENYMDIYTGTMDNSIGQTVSMPRNMVDDNRHNTCSQGLHFCSKEYLSHYGTSDRGTDRCLLVKINPMNVVSIPSDYNNAKGRTWCYEVVGEVEGNWRATLEVADYTSNTVVSDSGYDILDYDEDADYDEDVDEFEDNLRSEAFPQLWKWEDDEDVFIVRVDGFSNEYNNCIGQVVKVLKGTCYDVGHSSAMWKILADDAHNEWEQITNLPDEEADEELYAMSYTSGYRDGRIEVHANAVFQGIVGSGYEAGFKDGKNHRAKKYSR